MGSMNHSEVLIKIRMKTVLPFYSFLPYFKVSFIKDTKLTLRQTSTLMCCQQS